MEEVGEVRKRNKNIVACGSAVSKGARDQAGGVGSNFENHGRE